MHNIASIFLFVIFTSIISVECLPVISPDLEKRKEFRDEIHYPNGSVIGKYTYIDDKGNPIHVKYFADEGSYGVELKSVRTLDFSKQNLQQNKLNDTTERTLSPLRLSDPFLGSNSENPKNIDKDVKDSKTYLENNKENTYKTNMISDYDVYVKNDLEPPKNCKEKVRVYIDKLSRKSRGLERVYNKHEEIHEHNEPIVCHKY